MRWFWLLFILFNWLKFQREEICAALVSSKKAMPKAPFEPGIWKTVKHHHAQLNVLVLMKSVYYILRKINFVTTPYENFHLHQLWYKAKSMRAFLYIHFRSECFQFWFWFLIGQVKQNTNTNRIVDPTHNVMSLRYWDKLQHSITHSLTHTTTDTQRQTHTHTHTLTHSHTNTHPHTHTHTHSFTLWHGVCS